MADSAHRDEERMVEHFDSEEVLNEKMMELAALMRKAKQVVFYTGAGVSTSSGIPDYRGPEGVWTKAARGVVVEEEQIDLSAARPTLTHMAIAQLLSSGKVQGLISTNVDGLHRKTLTSLGVPLSSFAELHGNFCLERCGRCNRMYARDYCVHGKEKMDQVSSGVGVGVGVGDNKDHNQPLSFEPSSFSTAPPASAHLTGRRCCAPGCRGALRDTIIHFKENLPAAEIARGFEFSDRADLHVVLGSSLTVRPACDMPRATVEKGGDLVIVNLQKTPLDDIAEVHIHARCDVVMQRLMEELGEFIPPFVLRRDLVMWRGEDAAIHLCGLDAGDTSLPCSFIRTVETTTTSSTTPIEADPHTGVFSIPAWPVDQDCCLTLSFFGHYGEPDVTVVFPANQSGSVGLHLSLELGGGGGGGADASSSQWIVSVENEEHLGAAPPLRPPVFASAADLAAAAHDDDDGDDGDDGDHHTAPNHSTHGATVPHVDTSGWFAVSPLRDCPHLKEGVVLAKCVGERVCDASSPCDQCGNVGENMLCLQCGVVRCGRHVQGHMLAHNNQHKHPLVCGFVDISFWCYDCEAYIEPGNPILRPVYAAIHTARFGVPPPTSRAQQQNQIITEPHSVASPVIEEDEDEDQKD